MDIDNTNDPESADRGVADRVADALHERIADGRLAPGERLPGERRLAEQMGASRVSVRAALQRLKAQGFVVSVRGGGTRVVSSAAEMDTALTDLVRSKLDNLHDLAEIRLSLETWAARRAAERATPDQIAEIRARLDAMAAAEPQGRFGPGKAIEDVRFHVAIGTAAGSPVYMHILSVVRDVLTQMLSYHRYRLFAAPGDDETLLSQHRAIFEAIAAHRPREAEAAMGAHLQWILDRYRRASIDNRI
ncbi:FadR/GntR family transcriptional regulator [Fodinicurvata sp. EGI_FJ10296]|uniref:FadR/GntR family transcriptional regulator n=1 Tax=Fodinicurvata sp. EGI_FJ10296 TaxID=3231908 RepID=UPI00345601BA